MYSFSKDWFEGSDIKKYLTRVVDPRHPNRVLEIGSYEGASACFFSDTVLDHPSSLMVCVDPFDLSDTTTPLTSSTMNTFLNNIRRSRNHNKISFVQNYSSAFYEQNKRTFSFIYIDGSHLVQDIILDFTNCLAILEPNGILWMDDYLGGNDTTIKDTIDALYEKHKDKLQLIWKGYQIAFKRI